MNKKITTRSLTLLMAALLILAEASHALAGLSDGEKVEWTAKLKKDYPLETCVVSGDPLKPSAMGLPVDFLLEQKDKNPRLVRFCCKGCIKSFNKDSEKYLKMIDEAEAKKQASTPASPKPKESDSHAGHNH